MAFGITGFSGRFAQMFTADWIKPNPDVKRDERVQKQALQVLNATDGSQVIDNSHYHSPGLAIESSYQTSAALVNEYRAMGLDLDVDTAIDDIINAAITTDEDEPCVTIDLDKVKLSKDIKEKITDEFNEIINLLDMQENGYERMRQWYVDGRTYFQIVVDDVNKKEGIQALIPLDVRAIKSIKEVTKKVDSNTRIEVIDKVSRYYLYNPAWAMDTTFGATGIVPANSTNSVTGTIGSVQVLKLPEDMIAFVHSGILSPDGNMVFSNLEKARKPLNNLKMMRDALVIYRITRAPERRIFYIDVGSLPKKSAEEYVMSFINKNKSKVSYDPSTGKVSGHAYQQTMLEDFWLPRREGGRGTEIDTLQGGQNLGQIDDVLYFQKLLFRSLNVPVGRLENDNSAILIGGRGAEITRDEWKFNKFVQRLRRRYSGLFKQLLKIQLDLKGIAGKQDWDEIIEPFLQINYTADSYVKQQQEDEALLNKLNSLGVADQFKGIYYSTEWIKRNVLKQTEEEIVDEQEKMDKERKDKLNADVEGINATTPEQDDEGNQKFPMKIPFPNKPDE